MAPSTRGSAMAADVTIPAARCQAAAPPSRSRGILGLVPREQGRGRGPRHPRAASSSLAVFADCDRAAFAARAIPRVREAAAGLVRGRQLEPSRSAPMRSAATCSRASCMARAISLFIGAQRHAGVDRLRHRARPRRRLLRRLRRQRHLARHGPHRRDPEPRPRHPDHRHAAESEPREDDRRRHHRLAAALCAPGARLGAVGDRQGLRDGRQGRGRRPPAPDVAHRAAELPRAHHRAGGARRLRCHPRGRGARLPRARRPAADPRMGRHGRRRARIHPLRALDRDACRASRSSSP